MIVQKNLTVNVEPGAGGNGADSIGGLAPVEAPVTGEHRGDVEVAYHQPLPSQVLTNHHPTHTSKVLGTLVGTLHLVSIHW